MTYHIAPQPCAWESASATMLVTPDLQISGVGRTNG